MSLFEVGVTVFYNPAEAGNANHIPSCSQKRMQDV